jgi:hypothetical protein
VPTWQRCRVRFMPSEMTSHRSLVITIRGDSGPLRAKRRSAPFVYEAAPMGEARHRAKS